MWQRFDFRSRDGATLSAGFCAADESLCQNPGPDPEHATPASESVSLDCLGKNCRSAADAGPGWPPLASRTGTAPIVLIHGLGEHLGRYDSWAAEWSADGYNVLGFDLRGHGLSPGKRGDTRQLDDHVQDILTFLDGVHERLNRPHTATIPVIAHSMGGLLALRAAQQRPGDFLKLCLLAPYFRPAFQPQAWRLMTARMLSKWWPGLTLSVGLRWEQFARDLAVREAIRLDPLSHQRLSVRLAMELLANGEALLHSTETLAAKGYILHGDADTINCHAASQDFAQRQANVSFHTIPGGYHQIHNDSDTRPLVRDLIRAFLAAAD